MVSQDSVLSEKDFRKSILTPTTLLLYIYLHANLKAQTCLWNGGSDDISFKDNLSNCVALKEGQWFIPETAPRSATSWHFITNIIIFSLLNAEFALISGAAGLVFHVLSKINLSLSYVESLCHSIQQRYWRNTISGYPLRINFTHHEGSNSCS